MEPTAFHDYLSGSVIPLSSQPLRLSRFSLFAVAALVLITPRRSEAQEASAVAEPLLSAFTSQRVALMPAQLWRADTSGWSKGISWAETRVALDSALQSELRDRGLGNKWAYASDIVRSAKRNPTYSTDPYSLGVGRWRGVPPKVGEAIPGVIADNLRPLTALGDTRFALIPVELRAEGEAVVLRMILTDTRARSVVWVGDLLAPGGAGMIAALAARVADLVIEP